MERSILVIGATGAVGQQVLERVIASPVYSHVVVLTRREIPSLQEVTKVEQHVVDFDDLASYKEVIQADDVFCALGTTHKKAGSKEAFFRIDHDYPLEVARIAKDNGAKRYILISSLGANPKGPGNYLRTKGLLEQDLKALGFHHLVIMRPSLLLGGREEARIGEDLGKVFDRLFGWMLPRRYRGIEITAIAARVVQIAKEQGEGLTILESEEIPLSFP